MTATCIFYGHFYQAVKWLFLAHSGHFSQTFGEVARHLVDWSNAYHDS